MHALIVYAHPEPTSFTAAMKDVAVAAIEAAGHSVEVSDLYASGFDPVAGRHDFSTVADPARFHYQTEQAHAAARCGFVDQLAIEQSRLRRADLLILTFPLWWGGPPAILKGWLERVLAYGFAYVDGARFDKGLFKDKTGVMAVTTGGTPQRFSDDDVYGPIEKVLWPVQRLALEYMGMKVAEPFVAYATPRIDEAARLAFLEAWRRRVTDLLAEGQSRAA